MKSIKCFKYVNTKQFNVFLHSHGYKLDSVKGFGVYKKQQYHGNKLKEYIIYLNDENNIFFKEVCFKNFNEYRQAYVSFSCVKLSCWCSMADVRLYKFDGGYAIVH